MSEIHSGLTLLALAGQFEVSLSIATQVSGEATDGEQDGLDLWLLLGSVGLFVVIVVAITLLRRWR